MTAQKPGRKRVRFTFEGRTVEARAGQSIAAALMDSGTTVLTRSFKYRRPRGYTCGYDICGNCSMIVDGLPGVSTCTTPLRGGELVRRERGWPSTDRDVMRVADFMSRFLPAGFQFRLFRSSPRCSHLAESVMARIAGAGRFPTLDAADAVRARTETRRPDLLIVGGGLSGCAAALGAARTGASVMLAHRGLLGGRSLARPGAVRWQGQRRPTAELAAELAVEVQAHPRVEVAHGTALSFFETGVVPVLTDGKLIETYSARALVATGSYDVPALFSGNDLPGVVLADGVSRMLCVEGVVPWRRAVVLSDCDRGAHLATQLEEAGVAVLALVNDNGSAPSHHPRLVRGRVRAARGLRHLRVVEVEAEDGIRTLRADLLCVALRERPADDMLLQLEYARVGTPTSVEGGWPGDIPRWDGSLAVGSAAGWTEDDPERAYAVGLACGPAARDEATEGVNGGRRNDDQ